MSVEKKHNMPYKVPEGYFGNLQARLSEIPSGSRVPSRMDVLKPYLAMAAAFALIITAGTAVLRHTSGDSGLEDISTLDVIRLADLVPATDPYLLYTTAQTETEISDSDISEYLIGAGISLDYIEYCEK